MHRFIFVLCALLTAASPAVAELPNIVFIIGDDQAWTDYGFMGHPFIRTPHLDKLASQSLVYTRGYVPTSLCRASLATMITGLFPHQHKITSNDPPLPVGKNSEQASKDPVYLQQRREMLKLFEQSPTLPRLLAEKGYVSLQTGKWWEGSACRCGGFTEGMTHGDPTKGGRHGDVGLTIGRKGLQPVFDFIDQSQKEQKPFFVWYAPMMPHLPHNPPDRLLNHYQAKTKSLNVAKYWAMCEWFDETVGDLLKHLDDRHLAEKTIVLYLHDNGWIQDEKNNNFAPKSKRSPYDGGVRTPILIRWPGKVSPGKSEALAHSIDLAPTALHAAGIVPGKAMPGINLLNDQEVKNRQAVFGEIFEHNAIDISRPEANLQYRWLIEGKWKLIVPNLVRVPKDHVELYDILADPKEEKDVSLLHPSIVEALTKKLDQWWQVK